MAHFIMPSLMELDHHRKRVWYTNRKWSGCARTGCICLLARILLTNWKAVRVKPLLKRKKILLALGWAHTLGARTLYLCIKVVTIISLPASWMLVCWALHDGPLLKSIKSSVAYV